MNPHCVERDPAWRSQSVLGELGLEMAAIQSQKSFAFRTGVRAQLIEPGLQMEYRAPRSARSSAWELSAASDHTVQASQ